MLYDYFEVSPRIIPVNKPTKITIKARYEQRSFAELQKDGRVFLDYATDDGVMADGHATGWGEYDSTPAAIYDASTDSLSLTVCAPREGEYTYRLLHEPTGAKPREIFHFGIYALEKDLFELRPYKGDMHVHTSYSECGNRDENPRFVAAYACYSGLDYVAITDHMQYAPSLIARNFIDQFKLDFQVFPGEEIHLLSQHLDSLICRNRFMPAIHIVHFGGRQSVASYMNDHFDEYKQALDDAAAKLDPKDSASIRWLQAGADWIFDKIHEYGGLAIFAHPFWHPLNRTNLPAPVREYILKENKYDAMEVVGLGDSAQCREDIQVCVNWWSQANMKSGRMIPLVGNTDSHSTRATLNKRATIVFAHDKSFDSLAEAIRAGRSVAGTFNNGEGPVFYGDYRLVDFSYFLMREFYPEHDEVSKLLGSLLMDNLRGGCPVEAVAAAGQNRLTNLFNKYWA